MITWTADFLFSSPGMIALSVVVLIILLLAVVFLCMGLFSYYFIVKSRTEFLSSLNHTSNQVVHVSLGFLFWFYLFFTLFLVLLSSVLFLVRPQF